jgi:hypothetical protein
MTESSVSDIITHGRIKLVNTPPEEGLDVYKTSGVVYMTSGCFYSMLHNLLGEGLGPPFIFLAGFEKCTEFLNIFDNFVISEKVEVGDRYYSRICLDRPFVVEVLVLPTRHVPYDAVYLLPAVPLCFEE